MKNYFTKKLNNLTIDFWTEIEKNFVLYNNPNVEIFHEKETKFGKRTTSEVKSADGLIMLDDLRFKFGCDEEFAYDTYARNASIVIPNTNNMMMISKQFLKNYDEYINVVLAKLKLMEINTLLDTRKVSHNPIWESIFVGPNVSDDCATKGGGSVDFVYFTPQFRYFKNE